MVKMFGAAWKCNGSCHIWLMTVLFGRDDANYSFNTLFFFCSFDMTKKYLSRHRRDLQQNQCLLYTTFGINICRKVETKPWNLYREICMTASSQFGQLNVSMRGYSILFRVLTFVKPECDNVLQSAEPRNGEGCNILTHNGLDKR